MADCDFELACARHRFLASAACIVLGLGNLAVWAADGDGSVEPVAVRAPAVVTGFTVPVRTVTLAALQTGRIADIPIPEGQLVQADQASVLLDDTVQQRRVSIAKAQAESIVEIELAQVRLSQMERELARIESLGDDSFASTKELSDARAEVDAARLSLAKAEFEHAQALREYELQSALLDELCIKAPFTGYVVEHLKEVGDTVEEREGILTVVQLDPLVIELDCPLTLAPRVHETDNVLVTPVDALAEPRTGRVEFVSRVADAASQTLKIKIHVSNGDATWVAGMQVGVDLAHPVVALASDPAPRVGAVGDQPAVSQARLHR